MIKFLTILTGFLGPLGPVPQVYFTRMVRKSGPVSISLWDALEPENELLFVLVLVTGRPGLDWFLA